MMLSNEQVDLIDKEIDVALRLGSLPDSNLVAPQLAVLRTQVYASPAYLERHGEPLHPDDLQHHRPLGMKKMHRTNNNFSPPSDGELTVDYPIYPIMLATDPAAARTPVLFVEDLFMASDILDKTNPTK